MKLRLAWISTASVVAAGGVVWLLWPEPAKTVVTVTRQASTPPMEPARSPVVLAARTPLAQAATGVYDLTYNMDMTGASAEPGATDAALRCGVTARMTVTGRAGSASGTPDWLIVRLEQVTLQGDAHSLEAMRLTADAIRELQKPFAVRVAGDGQMDESRFAADVPTPVRAMLTAMLQAGQRVESSDATAATWQVREHDLNGTFDATYTRSGPALKKTWSVDGRQETDLAALVPPGVLTHATTEFGFAGKDLRQVDADQVGEIRLGGGARGTVSFHTHVQWKRVGAMPRDLAATVEPDALVLFDPAAEAAAHHVRTRKQVGVDQIDGLLQQASVAAARGDVLGRRQVGSLLVDAMLGNPTVPGLLKQKLAVLQDEPTRRTILEAMAAAGTPAAQASLVDAVGDSALEEATRIQALSAATFVMHPNEAFLTGLAIFAYGDGDAQFASASAVTLGAAILHEREGGAAQESAASKRFVYEAARRLGEPPLAPGIGKPPVMVAPTGLAALTKVVPVTPLTAHGRREWVRALGNAAVPSSLPIILNLFKDANEFVRESAVFSTRFFAPADVMPAILQLMPQEHSIHVREAVMRACLYLGPSPCKAVVERTLLTDPSNHVRESAAYTVKAWMGDTPGLVHLLEQAVATEKSPKVLETLKNFLKPGRVSAPFQLVSGTPEQETP